MWVAVGVLLLLTEVLSFNVSFTALSDVTRQGQGVLPTISAHRLYSAQVQRAYAPLPIVDYDYVKRAVSQNDVIIIDVREPIEIKEFGKIPNSINIPIGFIESTLAMSEEEFEAAYNRPKPKHDDEIIFYCKIGRRSGIAQRFAVSEGYNNTKNYLGSWTDWWKISYPARKSHVRRQRAIPPSTPFPCQESVPWGRSPEPPTSVHRLRPGDIDVVAAIGDSLVAGSGALEEFALGAFVEYRGVSWCAGGDASWREFLTLPNILKEFNPEVRGYSTGTGEWLTRNARLNVAFPVASDDDSYKQAKIIVARMRASPDIDIARHWKMITIFIGANDICSAACINPVSWSPAAHARKLARALDYLQKHLPRTIVNLVPVLDPSVSVRVLRPTMCRLMHSLFCSCFHRGQGGAELVDIIRTARLYQQAEKALVDSGRYDTRKDFTVVLQPFMRLFNAPLPPPPQLPLVIHQSYITHDCFHFSQKGHALAANLLWNNLLEPVGNKSDNVPPVLMHSFRCPSKQAPYIFTSKNSRTYLQTGKQDSNLDL